VIRFYFFLLSQLFLLTANLSAQQDTGIVVTNPVDSLPPTDSLTDSLQTSQMVDSTMVIPVVNNSIVRFDKQLPFLFQLPVNNKVNGQAVDPSAKPTGEIREFKGKDALFYTLIGLVMIFALLRRAFPKYFIDLFRLFFRTTLKQRQIREQLMQTPLPSLLLNGFFVICGGLYATFLLIHFKLVEEQDFWLFFLYSGLGLSVIYLVKFIGLKIMGWVFGLEEATNSYIFIVFIINKVIAVFLLPFLFLLAFLNGSGYHIALLLSWIVVGGLFLYRFILSYTAVHNQVKFNPFHFFLYLCAFEIAPLLLIYKLLLIVFQ
jgi:Domain of unknown function (DUF4271)